ncbi:MAG: hypothetical protein ACLVJO_11435 [[Clostridium] scindens]
MGSGTFERLLELTRISWKGREMRSPVFCDTSRRAGRLDIVPEKLSYEGPLA